MAGAYCLKCHHAKYVRNPVLPGKAMGLLAKGQGAMSDGNSLDLSILLLFPELVDCIAGEIKAKQPFHGFR